MIHMFTGRTVSYAILGFDVPGLLETTAVNRSHITPASGRPLPRSSVGMPTEDPRATFVSYMCLPGFTVILIPWTYRDPERELLDRSMIAMPWDTRDSAGHSTVTASMVIGSGDRSPESFSGSGTD